MAKPQDVKVVLEEHYREGKSYPYLLIDGRRIYFTYGIEFEMIITNPHYYDDDEDSGDDKIQEVNYLSQYGSVGEDRSVTCDSGVPIEFKTRKMSKNREQLSQWLQQVFNSEYRLVRGGTFNSSTGMHIHIKTSYDTPRIPIPNEIKSLEYRIGFDARTVNRVIRKLHNECKIPTIKNSFRRQYTNNRGRFEETRYKQINLANRRCDGGVGYGTVEYRLFNLHGINNYQEFENAVIHQLELLIYGTCLMLIYNSKGRTFKAKEGQQSFEKEIEMNNETTEYGLTESEQEIELKEEEKCVTLTS